MSSNTARILSGVSAVGGLAFLVGWIKPSDVNNQSDGTNQLPNSPLSSNIKEGGEFFGIPTPTINTTTPAAGTNTTQPAPTFSDQPDHLSLDEKIAAAKQESGTNSFVIHDNAPHPAMTSEEIAAMPETDRNCLVQNTFEQYNKLVNETPVAVSVPEEVKFATEIPDDLSPKDAWVLARAQVGVGGFYEYKGEVYTTYTETEWNQLEEEEKKNISETYNKYCEDNGLEQQDLKNISSTDLGERFPDSKTTTELSSIDALIDGVPHKVFFTSVDGSIQVSYDTDGDGIPDVIANNIEVGEDGQLTVLPNDDWDIIIGQIAPSSQIEEPTAPIVPLTLMVDGNVPIQLISFNSPDGETIDLPDDFDVPDADDDSIIKVNLEDLNNITQLDGTVVDENGKIIGTLLGNGITRLDDGTLIDGNGNEVDDSGNVIEPETNQGTSAGGTPPETTIVGAPTVGGDDNGTNGGDEGSGTGADDGGNDTGGNDENITGTENEDNYIGTDDEKNSTGGDDDENSTGNDDDIISEPDNVTDNNDDDESEPTVDTDNDTNDIDTTIEEKEEEEDENEQSEDSNISVTVEVEVDNENDNDEDDKVEPETTDPLEPDTTTEEETVVENEDDSDYQTEESNEDDISTDSDDSSSDNNQE